MFPLSERDDLSPEILDEVDDRLATLNASLQELHDGILDAASALKQVRRTTNSLKGLGQSNSIALLKVLAHRLEDYLSDAKTLEPAMQTDVQCFIDRMAEALETRFEASPEDIAAFVRKLPAKGVAGKSFDEKDLVISDIEVMLVMEPSTATRYVTRELQECGYRMTNVWSTIDAFQLVPHIRPDLVIVSNVMRDLSGVDFCCAIRAMPVTHHIPVALLTSEERGAHALEGLPADVPIVSKSRDFGDDVTQLFTSLGLI